MKKATRRSVRQGDVLLVPVDALPANLKVLPRSRGRLVIKEGETTGHAHAILERNAELLVDEKAHTIYLRIMAAPAVLRHEEHGAITLEPGIYRLPEQKEYHQAEIRRVAD